MKYHWDSFWGFCRRPRWGWKSAVPSGRVQRKELAQWDNQYPTSNGESDRQGIALIVVLGFLSIMIVMAVSFLTHSRMERMVAGTSLDAQRGRQLVRTALNAAMNDYSQYLGDNQLVMPVRSAEQLFTSQSSDISGSKGTIGGSDIELLVGEVEEWIPRYYLNDLNGPGIVANANWILVREDPTDGQSPILGRYAYACFDSSGGMDANLIARDVGVAANDGRTASNRVRRSVRQVPMRLLPETANASEFKRLRQGWKGFDSLQSVIKLTDGNPVDGKDGGAIRWQPEREEFGAGLSSNLVSDLTSFSLSAFRGASYSLASGLWAPYTLIDENTVWSSVLSPISSQFDATWGSWIDDAIYDFIHNDPVPRGTDYPSPKNVPMFNELAGDLQLVEQPDPANPGSATYTLQLRLNAEFWYPFPSEDNTGGTYELLPPTVGGSYSGSGGGENIWLRIALQAGGYEMVELDAPDAMPALLSVSAQYNNNRPYVQGAQPNFFYEFPVVRSGGDTNPLPPNATLWVQGMVVQQPIFLTAGSGQADRLPEGLTLKGAFQLRAGNPAVEFAVAATDPRLNHLPGQWVDENGGSGSLGELNVALQPGGNSYNDFISEGTNMYCRNGPMETPAELGFISTGKEWETIDLCTDAAVKLLATLVADTNLWESAGAGSTWGQGNVFYTNGTINPNTQSSNVLMSAFVDLSRHEVPNVRTTRISAQPLNDTTPDGMNIVQTLADEILKETVSGKIDNCFQAGTDWARIGAMKQGGDLARMGMNNNQRESLIRNTWGLFNPDNSLFTVVVVAQVIKEGPNNKGIWDDTEDLVVGERRAVALVWRDPYKTGQNLHHEMFVRMLRYLND